MPALTSSYTNCFGSLIVPRNLAQPGILAYWICTGRQQLPCMQFLVYRPELYKEHELFTKSILTNSKHPKWGNH